MSDIKPVALRLPVAVADRVDARAADVGISRHAWLVRAIEWALDQPITKRQTEQDV